MFGDPEETDTQESRAGETDKTLRVENHFKEHDEVHDMEWLDYGSGTNPSGIMKDKKSGMTLYVKQYRDWPQSCCEFIANRIYEAYGAPVLEGRLVPDKGRVAYATPFRSDFRKLPPERRKEAQKYFVIAAYLADYDMVGIGPENPYGNLQTDSAGNFHLVDHGASLLFKGLMGRKERWWINDSSVMELHTMRNEKFNPRSKVIFEDIPEEEIRRQARQVVEKITPDVIEKIVEAAMLPQEELEQVRKMLYNRRETLKRIYF